MWGGSPPPGIPTRGDPTPLVSLGTFPQVSILSSIHMHAYMHAHAHTRAHTHTHTSKEPLNFHVCVLCESVCIHVGDAHVYGCTFESQRLVLVTFFNHMPLPEATSLTEPGAC